MYRIGRSLNRDASFDGGVIEIPLVLWPSSGRLSSTVGVGGRLGGRL